MRCTKHFLVLIVALSVVLSGCDKLNQGRGGKLPQESETSLPVVAVPAKRDGQVAMLLPDFTQLVERDGTAVVNIQAIRDTNTAQQSLRNNSSENSPFPEDDPFFDFFRRLIPGQPSLPQQEPEFDAVSFGSGFITSPDGYILTNAHVVSNGGNIKVKLTDKREYSAKLVGVDKRSDVALIKIEAQNLPVVKIGNPAELKVGEWVAAIGAPFGFDNSVTAGIVSAKGRSLPDESYVPFIQTDVAINPGNSGGPLFNLKGQVVGINSQIYSRSGGFMGISFAIPIDIAMGVAEQLKKTGVVKRGQLGVYIQEVSQDLAKSFQLDSTKGALVVRVTPNGPGEKAGLKVGDIIIGFNGKPVDNSKDLPMMTGSLPPKSKVKLQIWRNGSEKEITVELGELTDENRTGIPKTQQNQLVQPDSQKLGKLGLSLAELTDAQKKELRLAGGLLVMQAKGIAAQAGLMRGDIVLGVNQTEVLDFKSFEKAFETAHGNVAFLVKRGEQTLYLAMTLN